MQAVSTLAVVLGTAPAQSLFVGAKGFVAHDTLVFVHDWFELSVGTTPNKNTGEGSTPLTSFHTYTKAGLTHTPVMPKLTPEEQSAFMASLNTPTLNTPIRKVKYHKSDSGQSPLLLAVERELDLLKQKQRELKQRKTEIVREHYPTLFLIEVKMGSAGEGATISRMTFSSKDRAQAAIDAYEEMDSVGSVTQCGTGHRLRVVEEATALLPEDMLKHVDAPLTHTGIRSFYK